MRYLLPLCLALACSPALAEPCKPIVITGNKAEVKPSSWCTRYQISQGCHMVPVSEFNAQDPSWQDELPAVVPTGKYLGVTSITFSEKFGDQRRHSYLVLRSLITITSGQGIVTYSHPVPLPPGFVLDGWVINNAGEKQNMNYMITAYLSSDPLFRDCK